MQKDICETLSIEYPILAFSHCRDVVAAVSNAGGLGVLGAVTYTPESLEIELNWIENETGGKPYGVDLLIPASLEGLENLKPEDLQNIDLKGFLPEEHLNFVEAILNKYQVPKEKEYKHMELNKFSLPTRLADVAFRHPIKLIASALGPPPSSLVETAHQKGVLVAALAGTKEHALRQKNSGVDIIIAQGSEAGGHTGEVGTMVLVPEVVEAVSPTPVLAAGGIATGRQMAAAMALGASGVWTGSVWLTTEEAETNPVVKEKMLKATSSDTVRSKSRTGKYARQLKSAWTKEWESAESPGYLPMPLQPLLVQDAIDLIDKAALSGHEGAKELANYFVGQVVGLMNSKKTAKQVVREMVEEYVHTIETLGHLIGK
jgi:NAD(P)H-dependent flavin oxidoreductase YrpB (nitropropane dioxygenase family)